MEILFKSGLLDKNILSSIHDLNSGIWEINYSTHKKEIEIFPLAPGELSLINSYEKE